MKRLLLLLVLASVLAGCRTPEGDIAPDGSRAVYSNANGLYLQDASGTRKRLFIGDTNSPEWSPDGRWILFEDAKRAKPLLYEISTGRLHALDPRLDSPWTWDSASTEILGVDRRDSRRIVVYHVHSRSIVRESLFDNEVTDLARAPVGRDFAVVFSNELVLIQGLKRTKVASDSNASQPFFDHNGNLMWSEMPTTEGLDDWRLTMKRWTGERAETARSHEDLIAALRDSDRIAFPYLVKRTDDGHDLVLGVVDASQPGVAKRLLELEATEIPTAAETAELKALEGRVKVRLVGAVLGSDGRVLGRWQGPVQKPSLEALPGDLDGNGRNIALVYLDRVRFVKAESG